jgi:hypothetical protein
MNYNLDTKDGMNNAVEWTRKHFDRLSDNAAWGVPRSGTVVRINKKDKLATIITGFAPDPSLKRVIEAMGWTVVEM